MKARSPHSSVVMDETVPLLQIKDLNVNLGENGVILDTGHIGQM
jgi:hypothetical protein